MDKIQEKASRLIKIRDYLFQLSPHGVSSSEIGRVFGIGRSAALKNLYSASELWSAIYQDDDRLWYFNSEAKLINVALNEDEVQILHIAARLYHQSIKSRFPASISLLSKLAKASEGVSVNLAEMIRETASEIDKSTDSEDQSYPRIIRIINEALHRGRNIELDYQRRDGTIKQYSVLPLMLEPYSQGKSLYLIGRDNRKERIITLRTEKIRALRLVAASRLINRSEHSSTLSEWAGLRRKVRDERRYSWGIWGESGARICVSLLFEASVADRVRQTIWHPFQKIKEEESGGVIWTLELTEIREIIPWIRSWGSAVEVLEPIALRQQVFEDIKKSLGKYKK